MPSSSTSQEFTLLLTRHQTSLYGYILSLIADRSAAEDILQDTNVTLLQKSDSFELGTDFLAWASTIARYKVLHARRAFAKDQQRFSEGVIEQIADRLASPMEAFDDRRAALRQCLDLLREPDLQLLRQRYQAGASIGQLAEATGASLPATSQKLYRIRGQLLDCVRTKLSEMER